MQNIVKITTVLNPIDLLAPHSCRGCGRIGSVLCDRCKNYIIKSRQNFCPNCKKQNLSGKCSSCKLPPIYTASHRNSLVGNLIEEYKYHSVRAAAKPLAEILNQTIPNADKDIVIVPLPTISYHIRQRGLDHTLLLAKKLASLRPNFTVNPLLQRINNSVQVGSTKKDRLVQAKSAYQINPKIKIKKSATYLLLDDVWTTGASMQNAVKKLRKSGVSKIIIAVLAVS